MKWFIIISMLLVSIFSGCSESSFESKGHKKFVDQYGSDSRYHCNEAGFLEQEYFLQDSRDHPSRSLVTNDAQVPIRCNVEDIQIRVKESVATGSLSGGV